MKKALVLLAAIPMLVAAADWETGSLMNGRGWSGMSEYAKATYLRGAYDCAAVALALNPMPDKKVDIFYRIEITGSSLAEIAKAIDAFYSDSMNSRIPIVSAMAWVKMKHDGSTPQTLEETLAKLRSIWNGFAKPNPTP